MLSINSKHIIIVLILAITIHYQVVATGQAEAGIQRPQVYTVSVKIYSPNIDNSTISHTCPEGTILTITTRPGPNWTVSVSADGNPPPEDLKCIFSILEMSGFNWTISIVDAAIRGSSGLFTPDMTIQSMTQTLAMTQTVVEPENRSLTTAAMIHDFQEEAETTAPTDAQESLEPVGSLSSAPRAGIVLGLAMVTGLIAVLVVSWRGSW